MIVPLNAASSLPSPSAGRLLNQRNGGEPHFAIVYNFVLEAQRGANGRNPREANEKTSGQSNKS